MALKDLGEKGIVNPYPPLVDIKGRVTGDATLLSPLWLYAVSGCISVALLLDF